MKKEKYKYIYYILPLLLGIIFILYYISIAQSNVVYTDYIRETNQYLGNRNWLKDYIFDWSFFSRPPIKMLEIYINFKFFHFNTMLDMYLGAIGLILIAFIMTKVCYNNKMFITNIILCLLIFSLSKWEMVTNGTGWIHFWAFLGFYLHFYLVDQIYIKLNKNNIIKIIMIVLPVFNILFVATFYCAIYSIVMIGLYSFIIIRNKINRKKFIKIDIIYLASIIIPFVIYVICMIISKDSRVIANESFFSAFKKNPRYFFSFFIKSFASDIIGIEEVQAYNIKNIFLWILGLILIVVYLYSIFINIKYKIYKYSFMPILLLISGFLNHLIILYSRWGFLSDIYGMSSRYSLQYMSSTIGLVLTVMYLKKMNLIKNIYFIKLIILIILIGNIFTTLKEIQKAPYRKEYVENLKEIGLNYELASNEDLSLFQSNIDSTRKALSILKEYNMNIFYN